MNPRVSPTLHNAYKTQMQWNGRARQGLRRFTTTGACSRATARPFMKSSPSRNTRPQCPLLTASIPRRHQSTSAPISSGAALPRVLVNDMTNQELIVDFNTGTALRYPSFWLRDHCPCPECQHPSTHQRQLDTFAIDPEIKVSSVQSTPEGLEVTWPATAATTTASENAEAVAATGGEGRHTSLYAWEWLQAHPPFIQTTKKAASIMPKRRWVHVSPSSSPLPRVPYSSIMDTSSPLGLAQFLESIHTYGLCFIPSTPPTPSATQSLVERISHIRPTHYGAFWDFTSEPNPIDTAYTDDYLPPHTDTTYFTDPAGLQLFHCLTPADKGGESTFVDGFAAAAHLYEKFPQHYRALSTYPVMSAALGSSAGEFYNTASSLQGYPVLVHSSLAPGSPPSSSPAISPASLVQIRWNNLDRVPPTSAPFPNHTALKSWYAAAREWTRILESPEFLLTVTLRPGEPVIFDNWRVLHGRLGFEGKRRVCGAYVGMDDFRARCRALGVVDV